MTCHIVSSVWHMKDPVIAKSSAAFKYNQKYCKNDFCQLFFKSKSGDQDVVKVGQALINDLRTMLQAFSTLHSPTSAQSSSVLHQFSKQTATTNKKTFQVLFYLQPNITLRWNKLYFQYLVLNKADCKEHLKAAFLSRYNSSPASNNRTDDPNHS